ncbi:hypothetical protein L6773_20965 [Rhodohalobacter sp. WB101]|uniref:Uncharacterized protein n=1 Tax=Rhodohalobacter sulfatireducens TaxID=2911366 RepID=A0ABS9KJL4_9BACT|nr:hypothetical protein [Rhodohalobacter sulfatireducens]
MNRPRRFGAGGERGGTLGLNEKRPQRVSADTAANLYNSLFPKRTAD